MKVFPKYYPNIRYYFKENKTITLIAVSNCGMNMKHSYYFINDKDICMAAINNNPKAFIHIGINLLKDYDILSVIHDKNPSIFSELISEKKEIIRNSNYAKENPGINKYLDKNVETKEDNVRFSLRQSARNELTDCS